MKKFSQLICATLIAAGSASWHANAQGQWPVQPVDRDHPLGATLGEFQDGSTGVFQHTGIDILAAPCQNPCLPGQIGCVNPCTRPCSLDPTDDDVEPCVYVTVPGKVFQCIDSYYGTSNAAYIDASDPSWPKPRRYRYLHLRYGSYTAEFMNACKRQEGSDGMVASGVPIARITPWTCAYNHLHYDVEEGVSNPSTAEYLNPLDEFAWGVNPDTHSPEVLDIHFAEETGTRWSGAFDDVATTSAACAVVKGKVDIIARVLDRDDAGAALPDGANVGFYNLRWRACSEAMPDCEWHDTHEFTKMPAWWGDEKPNPHTLAQFSTACPWMSDCDECSSGALNACMTPGVNATFAVATSAPSAPWDTTAVADGSYTVTVEASDHAGNVATRTELACVQNTPPPACTLDLAIRDGVDDAGVVPYAGSPFWLSPDIIVNPGTIDENRNVNEGAANVIKVNVHNIGSCPLPVGTSYQMCLGWSPPSGSVPFPMSAGQTVECRTETVAGSDWVPGEIRPVTFTWTPAIGSVPGGHSCLVAWSNVPTDPVQSTASVVFDNNRAQRNIVYVPAPEPYGMALQPIWLNPLDRVLDRSLEITFKSNTARQYLKSARIHVPAGVTIAYYHDTELIGGYLGSGHLNCGPQDDDRTCRSECPRGPDGYARGCTIVLGRIGPRSHVRLEGIELKQAAQLRLEVRVDEAVPPGAFFDAEIVEFGSFGHQTRARLGGLTLRFEGPAPRQ